MADPRSGRAYRHARATFLANSDGHPCHWCHRPVSTTVPPTHRAYATVDHLIEVDRAPGLALDTDLWVVACYRCNASRGARYGNRRRGDRRRADGPRSSRDW